MEIDAILSSIQSRHAERMTVLEYACLNDNNNKTNAYIFIAKVNSSDHSSLTPKEDVFIWP